MPEESKLEQQKIVAKLDKMFQSCLDHPTWKSWQENAVTCYKYREGEQWTTDEKAELKNRNQPITVNNQIKVTVDRMIGQFVKQKTRIGFRGRNDPQDEGSAQAITDAFRYIHQNNNLEFEEREMADDGFTGGFGVLETYVSFDNILQPEIKVKQEDPFSIHPDPESRRYDWNEDATFICRDKFVDVEEAKELYPDQADRIAAFSSNDNATDLLSTSDALENKNYFDEKRNRIRLVEVWYKIKRKKTICVFDDGEILDHEGLTKKQIKAIENGTRPYKNIERIVHTMKVGVFSGPILFEHKEVNRERFPFVPFFSYRKKSGEPYSVVLTALSMQDAINKRESKAMHLLNMNQAIYEKQVIRDKNELAYEMSRPDGQVELEPGALSNGRFQIEKNLELASTQFQMHLAAKEALRHITGINPDALGEKSEVRSGVGIARKQAMTDVILAPVFDNLRRTKIILAKNVLELIQKYYTYPKLFMITDDMNESRQVMLNMDGGQAIKQSTYDVIVEEMPDLTTSQQEQFQMLGQMLPQMIPYGPGWTTILLEMSDLKNKRELIQKVEKMSQPRPPDPKISVALQWTEMSPVEKALFAQKMGMNELAQAEMQQPSMTPSQIRAQVDVKNKELDSKTRLAEAAIKAQGEGETRDLKASEILVGAQQNAKGNSNKT